MESHPRASRATAQRTDPGLQTNQVDDRRRQIAEADCVWHNTLSLVAGGRNDQQRYADFIAVHALAMVKETVITQSFTVIGSNDDQCSIEHTASCQFVKQLTQLLIEISHAIVVAVLREISVDRTQL